MNLNECRWFPAGLTDIHIYHYEACDHRAALCRQKEWMEGATGTAFDQADILPAFLKWSAGQSEHNKRFPPAAE